MIIDTGSCPSVEIFSLPHVTTNRAKWPFNLLNGHSEQQDFLKMVFHENDSSIFSTFILRLSRNSRDPLCDKTFFFLHSYWRCMQSPIYFLSSCRVINKFRQILKILSPARHVNYFLLFTYSSIQLIV